MSSVERRGDKTIEPRLDEIQQRVANATPDLAEEAWGWVISESLRHTSPAGCRVYSPTAGIKREGDYQLFLHAYKDITFLLEHIGHLEARLNEGQESKSTGE